MLLGCDTDYIGDRDNTWNAGWFAIIYRFWWFSWWKTSYYPILLMKFKVCFIFLFGWFWHYSYSRRANMQRRYTTQQTQYRYRWRYRKRHRDILVDCQGSMEAGRIMGELWDIIHAPILYWNANGLFPLGSYTYVMGLYSGSSYTKTHSHRNQTVRQASPAVFKIEPLHHFNWVRVIYKWLQLR